MTTFPVSENISPANAPPPMYAHQEDSVQFKLAHKRMIDGSDPGTGKSRTGLEAFSLLKAANQVDRMLVLAPLSILRPSWQADCRQFTPHLSCSIVTAKEKLSALPPQTEADIYVANHDAVKWLKDWKPPKGERPMPSWVMISTSSS